MLKCPLLAAMPAVSRLCYSLIELSITSWSRRSHSSSTCWCSSSTSIILWCLYARCCTIPTLRSQLGSDQDCLVATERAEWKKMKRGRDCLWNTNILDFQILQGSVAIQLKWGGSLYNRSIEIFLLNLIVKELWQSVVICRSYDQKTKWLFF